MTQRSGEPADAAFSGDVAVFSDYLRSKGMHFLVLEETAAQARVRFVGLLQGETVVWDCRFLALREARQRFAEAPGAAARPMRNFIDIGAPDTTGVPIRVGLDIERIDEPAILKMIVMIRNYKRLKPGRHEFGG